MEHEIKEAPISDAVDVGSNGSTGTPSPEFEKTHGGVVLIPQPSDNPRDPLV